jgi:hypothetical protein
MQALGPSGLMFAGNRWRRRAVHLLRGRRRGLGPHRHEKFGTAGKEKALRGQGALRLRAQFVRTVWVASTQDSTGLSRPRIIVPRKYSHTVQAPQLEGGPHYAGYATQRSLGGWQRLHAYYNRGLRIEEVNYNRLAFAPPFMISTVVYPK